MCLIFLHTKNKPNYDHNPQLQHLQKQHQTKQLYTRPLAPPPSQSPTTTTTTTNNKENVFTNSDYRTEIFTNSDYRTESKSDSLTK